MERKKNKSNSLAFIILTDILVFGICESNIKTIVLKNM